MPKVVRVYIFATFGIPYYRYNEAPCIFGVMLCNAPNTVFLLCTYMCIVLKAKIKVTCMQRNSTCTAPV